MASRPPSKSPQRNLAMQTEDDYQSCASRLKALADPDRLMIVNSLLRGDKSVSALADELNVGIDKISHHLGVLRAANFVQSRKQGRFVIYSLTPEVANVVAADDAVKTIDLGCCQLDLVQPELPPKESRDRSAKKQRNKS